MSSEETESFLGRVLGVSVGDAASLSCKSCKDSKQLPKTPN